MSAAYLSGTSVTLTFPLVDEDGNVLSETASFVSYRVLDQNEVELVALSPAPCCAGADAVDLSILGSVDISIPGDINTIRNSTNVLGFSPSPTFRQVRVVELYVTMPAGTTKLTQHYFIEAEEVLVEGVNSFQGYPLSLMVSGDLPNVPGWNGATKRERITALIRARQNIGQLRFRYVFDAYQNIVDNTLGVADLTLATPSQYAAFPIPFKEALRRAQILEADFLLGGDEIGDIRREGIMSMTTGEAKQFFRPGKAFEGVVCKRAMKELTKWVLSRHRLTRS